MIVQMSLTVVSSSNVICQIIFVCQVQKTNKNLPNLKKLNKTVLLELLQINPCKNEVLTSV